MRTYALLEAGIAVTALVYFLLLDLYQAADRPLIEYLSPRINREHFGAGKARVLAFTELGDFCDELLASAPPWEDPFLAVVPAASREKALAAMTTSIRARRTLRPAPSEAPQTRRSVLTGLTQRPGARRRLRRDF